MTDYKSKKTSDSDAEQLRITTQYRGKHGMIYEMNSREGDLDIHVRSEGLGGAIRIEARNGRLADAIVIQHTGSSRRAVLSEVGRLWTSRQRELGLPHFDWNAVTALLASVRAI